MGKLNLAVYFAGALCLAVPGISYAQTSASARLRVGEGKVEITAGASQFTISTDSIRDHLCLRNARRSPAKPGHA